MFRLRAGCALALALAAGALPGSAEAAPGDLDPTFGSGGIVLTDFGGADEAYAVLVLPDGKLIAGGEFDPPGTPLDDFALARYTRAGALDPLFSGDGRVTTDFGGFDNVNGVVRDAGGNIVAAGHTTAGNDFALARYTAAGELDPSFDGDGKVTTDFGGFEFGRDVAIQPDGKLVVVGNAGGNFGVARYNHDGSLDATFGASGKVTTDFGGTNDLALAVRLQADGRIVAAGHTPSGGNGDFALARYAPDGTLDPTFDGDGRVVVDFSGGGEGALDLVILSDGTMVVAGTSDPPGATPSDFALVRLKGDGSLYTLGLDRFLDPPFGTGGKVTTDFGGAADSAAAVAVEPGGNLVVVGETGVATADPAFALARYRIDGSLDASFGMSGQVTTNLSVGSDRAGDVAIQRDGAIVVVGGAALASFAADFALARYSAYGCCFTGGMPLASR